MAKTLSDPKPVEGKSEIDIVVETDRSLVFIEAKLGSDISSRTTYDVLRNQIARNIDCLLESAKGRTALFWMLVKNRDRKREYMKLIESYRSKQGGLAQQLGHRNEADVRQIGDHMATILWTDVLAAVKELLEQSQRDVQHIMDELQRRTSA